MNTITFTPATVPVYTVTPAVQQQFVQQNVHVHYHLPPAPPPNYGLVQFAIPQPTIQQSSPPAGRGVTGAPRDEGWPEESFRTAGGYTVVFDGTQSSMKIYGPDQGPDDKPLTKVWGDPHVDESDGTRWDFTKDGDMVLPDGTLLALDTTAQTGFSLLESVTIVNGDDRVEISGISSNDPESGYISDDGFEWRAQHIATHAGTDYKTFIMSEDGEDDVGFNLFYRGVDQGEVIGAEMRDGSYEQETDGGQLYQPDPSTLPPLGSPAWGNAVRSTLLDQLATSDPALALEYGAYFSADHNAVSHASSRWGIGVGGLGGLQPNWLSTTSSLAGMGNIVLLQQQAQLGFGAANPMAGIAGPGVGSVSPWANGGAGFGGAQGFGGAAAPGGAVGGGAGWPAGLPAGLPAGGNQAPVSGMPLPQGNHVIQNSDIPTQDVHQAQIDAALNDPSLSVEDKVMLTLMLIMKKMDNDIEGQAEYINNSQNQKAEGAGPQQGGNVENPSIDIETMKLERMVKKRGHMFEMLKSLISKYDETAKSVNQSIGR